MKKHTWIRLTLIGLCILLPVWRHVSGVSAEPAGTAQDIASGTDFGMLRVRIAFPEFQPRSTDPRMQQLTSLFNQVLWDDLDFSGAVDLVSRSFQPAGRFSAPVDILPDDWTAPRVDAQFLVFGNVQETAGRLSIEARLWDLKLEVSNREFLAVRLGGDMTEEYVRVMAHNLADSILDKLFSGRTGIARTKIAYVSERSAGVKEIYVMDYDGANLYPVTSSRETSVTPSWAPDTEKIAFGRYKGGAWNISVLSSVDRREFVFADVGGGTNATPAWSPDGSRIAFSSSRDGSDMEIYVADWNGRNLQRLTRSQPFIDISPSWNPVTGRQIAFISNRSGSPQIWIMEADGTNPRRIINEGGEAQNPAWSPDGRNIAFAWKKTGTGFNIYIHNLASGRNVQLTNNQGDNERPSWAPDARHLVFESSRSGGRQLFSMLADGTKVRQLTRSGKNEGPSWSGFIN